MSRSGDLRGRVRARWRVIRRRLRRFAVRQDLGEGWLVLVIAALIGTGAGLAIVAFYGAVDLIRTAVAGLGDRLDGPAAAWIPLDDHFIPVVEREGSDRLVGLLRRADLMETYEAHLMLRG